MLLRKVLPLIKTPSILSSLSIAIVLSHLASLVSGHGRLIEPPSRSSMWRFGFKTRPNYNDNELFCGGYTVHWQRNGGKCGVCGDAWHLPKPRPNEAGGIYGQGVITRNYKPGQVIKSTVDITANHRGFFEFKLCPHNNPSTEVNQECLDHYPLELADGSGTRYYPSVGTGKFSVQLVLPHHMTCSQCVFQWTYTAGNNWGRCDNGTSKVGCGPQETFRGCSDIAIGDSETNDIPFYNERPPEKPSISAIPPRRPRPPPPPVVEQPRPPRPSPPRRPYYSQRPLTTRKPYVRKPRPTRPKAVNYDRPNRWRTTRRPTQWTRPTPYRPIYTPRPTPHRPLYNRNTAITKIRPTYKAKVSLKTTNNIEVEGKGGKCKAVGVWSTIAGIAGWCDTNCARGYCPSSHCDCS